MGAKRQQAKGGVDQANSAIKLLAQDLIKIFNGNARWKATEMNAGEVAIISSGLAMSKVENEKFIADLADVMRNTIKDAGNMDLILLAKGAFYMRSFPHSKDVYS